MYKVVVERYEALSNEIIKQLLELNHQIPELESGLTESEITQRLSGKSILILIAKVEGEIAGFKLGYQQDSTLFYSWLGGVAQDYRGLGIAKLLLNEQEKWAKAQDYQWLQVKTKNCYLAMLSMLVNHRYNIIEFADKHSDASQNKLLLEKML
ncbi:N-acetyltransferase [Parashewanella spongiae]|uniref:N-acetyltransferase n=1 Tax=Parashewanella spongiae TaxID=342950 RepID=A0A3A6TQT3_9GAMM|nr:GNAT family N-acetyltransferase [Parashewanella spongiae]MCL1079089.1 GNAT family N-acetyltransferase [Parashewanella spongiae]RJY10701.1 N-acetyltransferase [Parashewanella spongiae]